jgi:hypothetical protein
MLSMLVSVPEAAFRLAVTATMPVSSIGNVLGVKSRPNPLPFTETGLVAVTVACFLPRIDGRFNNGKLIF